MARTAGKKQPKPASQSVSASATTSTTPSSIPEPFVLAPAQLRPLTSTLPTDHVFTVHIDKTPAVLKQRVFVVPMLINLVIAGILAIRVYYAAPVYLDQIITIFGYDTAHKVEPNSMSFADLMSVIVERTGLLMMDYTIFAFLGSWPWEWLFGSKYSRRTGALAWRRNVGFRETEIIVRRGRKWDTPLFPDKKKKADTQTWTREDELLILKHVEPAMRQSYTSKTGYLLLDKDWDLDFRGMIDAHRLVDKARIALKDLDHIVLVPYQNQWLLWRIHAGKETVASNLEEDATIRKFRERLVALGHEEVFFRWIEIVQYETSIHGALTGAKQAEVLNQLKQLLSSRKIDYDQFLREIGGQQGIPGLAKVE